MLTIKCSACGAKLFRYRKIGTGRVLRCHKARITRVFAAPVIADGKALCPICGQAFARDEPALYDMIRGGFTDSGKKERA